MGFLKHSIFAGAALGALFGCGRDFSTPWSPTGPHTVTAPGDTTPRDTLPRDTLPRDTIPKDTIPKDTIPKDTIPKDTIPRDTIPKDTVPGIDPPPVDTPVRIELLTALDLVLAVGEIQPAQVEVRPRNATSPRYEMTSRDPEVAEAGSEGILGTGIGVTTVDVHALDGSGITARFLVMVLPDENGCMRLPCPDEKKKKEKGKGKDGEQ